MSLNKPNQPNKRAEADQDIPHYKFDLLKLNIFINRIDFYNFLTSARE